VIPFALIYGIGIMFWGCFWRCLGRDVRKKGKGDQRYAKLVREEDGVELFDGESREERAGEVVPNTHDTGV